VVAVASARAKAEPDDVLVLQLYCRNSDCSTRTFYRRIVPGHVTGTSHRRGRCSDCGRGFLSLHEIEARTPTTSPAPGSPMLRRGENPPTTPPAREVWTGWIDRLGVGRRWCPGDFGEIRARPKTDRLPVNQ